MIESPSYKLHKLVFSLDREASRLVKTHLNISYRRVLFLVVLYNNKPLTQHELAGMLGYSDAAVSLMLKELREEGCLTVAPSPEHGRKKIVFLTQAGESIAQKASKLLDEKFAQLGRRAGVELTTYAQSTEQLYQALNNEESRKEKHA